jgi:hypothetical protein
MNRNYSTVASTIALVLVVGGGTVYAANKIGSDDIKKDAIQSKHIDDRGVTGKDVKESSLGAVPNAKAVGGATIAPIDVSVAADENGTDESIISLGGAKLELDCQLPPGGGVNLIPSNDNSGDVTIGTDLRAGSADALNPGFLVQSESGSEPDGIGSEEIVAGSVTLQSDTQVIRADITGLFENGVGGADFCEVTGTATSFELSG